MFRVFFFGLFSGLTTAVSWQLLLIGVARKAMLVR